ncbi:MAG TPA: hypothetical protein VHM91_12290 [Verrucomicrobiales bacterium]|jgi:hypothetical protein|nr:hypothetical protein [Verrucomicrobiales bacterium]
MDIDLPPPSDLLAMLIFSVIGIIFFRIAKREAQPIRLIISMCLMLYPYFVPGGIWVWLAGAALTGALWFFKD